MSLVSGGLGSPGGLVVSRGLGRSVSLFLDIIRRSLQITKTFGKSLKIDKKVERTLEH